jgi:hypothetical protein
MLLRISGSPCCSYGCLVVVPAVEDTFTLLTSKDAPPKMKRNKKTRGETTRPTQENYLMKIIFPMEKTFSFSSSSCLSQWGILHFMKARKFV